MKVGSTDAHKTQIEWTKNPSWVFPPWDMWLGWKVWQWSWWWWSLWWRWQLSLVIRRRCCWPALQILGPSPGGGLHISHIWHNLHNFTYILNNFYVWTNLHILFAINIPIGGPLKYLFVQNVLDERRTNCSQRLRPIVDCKGNLPSRSAVANDAPVGGK